MAVTVTARFMIQDAFEQIQVYAPGETLLDADAARGFSVLNAMLDSWSNESLMCYTILEQSGTLTPGVSAYTIGAGGTFNITRPLRIIEGPGAAYMLDQNNEKYDLEVLDRARWNMIGQINNVDTNIPTQLFYDPQYPLGVLNFYPIPNIGITAYWDSYLQLSEFSSLSSNLFLPPGYQMAIQDNLALLLAKYYPTAVVTPDLRLSARESKGAIKRTNARPIKATFDPEIVSKGQGTYNIYNDKGG